MKSSALPVIVFSLIVSLLLTSLKFYAYFLTDSISIFSDALESIVNVVAAAFATYSVYLAARPKDHSHPYGHGKVEFFSVGMEGAMILAAGIMILIKTIRFFLDPYEITKLDSGAVFIAITFVVNLCLGWYLKSYGKKNASLSIAGNGTHLLTDAWTSIALVLALLMIHYTGWTWLDPLASIVMCTLILISGYRMVRSSVRGLMDETDQQLIEKLVVVLRENRRDCWIDVHNLRIQQYGQDIHIDCHMTLPFYFDLNQMHDEVKQLEEVINTAYNGRSELFIHIDPCIQSSCSVCSLMNCPKRQSPQTRKIDWTSEWLTPNKKHELTLPNVG